MPEININLPPPSDGSNIPGDLSISKSQSEKITKDTGVSSIDSYSKSTAANIPNTPLPDAPQPLAPPPGTVPFGSDMSPLLQAQIERLKSIFAAARALNETLTKSGIASNPFFTGTSLTAFMSALQELAQVEKQMMLKGRELERKQRQLELENIKEQVATILEKARIEADSMRLQATTKLVSQCVAVVCAFTFGEAVSRAVGSTGDSIAQMQQAETTLRVAPFEAKKTVLQDLYQSLQSNRNTNSESLVKNALDSMNQIYQFLQQATDKYFQSITITRS